MLSFNVAVYLASSATVAWSLIEHKPYLTILIAAIWAALILSLRKMKLSIPQSMLAAAFVLVATVVTVLTVPTKDGDSIIKGIFSKTTTTGGTTVEKTETPDPAGTILINGKDGVLTGAGPWSNISNIERDNGFGEAYLGDKGGTATYTFESLAAGTFNLWVKLSDDAQHMNGARSATVTLNNSQTIKYSHVSEDTRGWKWYRLGTVTLSAGTNTAAFTKDSDTSAAYVMNQFKFVPQK